jgi:DNA-binding response OmpR family regulator
MGGRGQPRQRVTQTFVTARTPSRLGARSAAVVRYSSVVEEVVPASSSPCVLVVADPGRVGELAQALADLLPQGSVDVAVSSGGDDTIELFEARKPRVVVLDASLEVGDAKSLIETLREMVPRDELVIVLVGDDEKGPIRNALDAIDMKPDRFVSRPLHAKALRFAVGSGLTNVARALGEIAADGGESAELPPNVHVRDGADLSLSGDEAERVIQPVGSRTSTPVRGSGELRRSIPPTAELTPVRDGDPNPAVAEEPPATSRVTTARRVSGPVPLVDDDVHDEPTAARVTATRGSVKTDEPAVSRSITATRGSGPVPLVDDDVHDEPTGARMTATRASVKTDEPTVSRSITATRGSGPVPLVDDDVREDTETAVRVNATHGSDSADEPSLARSITAPRGSGPMPLVEDDLEPTATRDGPTIGRSPTNTRVIDDPSLPRSPTPQRGSGPLPLLGDADQPFARPGTAPRFSSLVEAGDVPPVVSRAATRPVMPSNGGDLPAMARSRTDRGTGIVEPPVDPAAGQPLMPRAPTDRGTGIPPLTDETTPNAAGDDSSPNVPRAPTDRGTGITMTPPAGDHADAAPPQVSRAALRARWEALADSIGGVDDDDDEALDEITEDRAAPLPPIEIQPRKKGNTNPEFTPVPPVAPWRPGTTSELQDDEISPPVREPTLILNDDAPARVTPPPELAPAMPTPSVAVTERSSHHERWSQPVLLSELIDRSRDSSRELLANVGGADDLAGLDELDDDIIVGHPVHTPPPHVLRGGKLQRLEDLVDADDPNLHIGADDALQRGFDGRGESGSDRGTRRTEPAQPEPPREPPSRPSDDKIGGRDFARQLRAKMSMMAQRLFQSDSRASQPSVDVRPRHDHHTEIDLAALGEEPALGGGVTEIGRPTMSEPVQLATSPGSWDTQVRERGLPDAGEIVRGVSDGPMVLARMFALNFTGRVGFRKDDVEKVVYFDQGRPVFASSNEPGDRMGELLVREGKITASQYERCQVVVAQSGRRMGEILVDFGYLKRRELLPAVRRHVEDILYSLFGWDRGHYHVTTDVAASAERIRLSRHPASLVLEGIRRKLGRTTLEKVLGPPSTVIEVPDRERLGGILNTGDLAVEERTALAAFDGQADLASVARTTGVDIADVLPLAWGLCVLGLATARRAEIEVEESTALVGETDIAIDRERVRARWQLVTEADYFALLGVRRDATGFEIRRAYQAARRDFAPDGFPTDLRRELARELEEIGSVLDEAFRVLRDDRLRQTYLANLFE